MGTLEKLQQKSAMADEKAKKARDNARTAKARIAKKKRQLKRCAEAEVTRAAVESMRMGNPTIVVEDVRARAKRKLATATPEAVAFVDDVLPPQAKAKAVESSHSETSTAPIPSQVDTLD